MKVKEDSLTNIGGVMFSEACLSEHKSSLAYHYGAKPLMDPRSHIIWQVDTKLRRGDVKQSRPIWRVTYWVTRLLKYACVWRSGRQQRVQSTTEVEYYANSVKKNNLLVAAETEAQALECAKNIIPGYYYLYDSGFSINQISVAIDTNYMEVISEGICVYDLCWKHGDTWAYWYMNEKIVVFYGLFSEVPDMPSDHCPTDADLEVWLNKYDH